MRLSELPSQIHKDFRSFCQRNQGTDSDPHHGLQISEISPLTIRTFYQPLIKADRVLFLPRGQLEIGKSQGISWVNSITQITDHPLENERPFADFPNVTIAYNWDETFDPDFVQNKFPGFSLTVFDMNQSELRVEFDQNGRFSYMSHLMPYSKTEGFRVRYQVSKESPCRNFQNIREFMGGYGFRLAANDRFHTFIFLERGVFTHRLVVPTQHVNTQEILIQLVPQKLVDNPRQMASELDSGWVSSDLYQATGINPTPINLPYRNPRLIDFSDMDALVQLAEDELAEQEFWEAQ